MSNKTIPRILKRKYSPIEDTDSYKLSHWVQYPEGLECLESYFVARGGSYSESTIFGLQALLHRYLSVKVTASMVQRAAEFAGAHGEPFNFDGWMRVVTVHKGKLPIQIRAIPEGLVVPVGNLLIKAISTDPELPWIESWFETMLVRLWYPSTVAISSRESKKVLSNYLRLTSDLPTTEAVLFKLHDFGARGVSCFEESELGGAAHLLNFRGSDTIAGINLANHYYSCGMAGFSIAASEHSTVSQGGPEGELEFFKSFVSSYLVNAHVPEGIPKMAACVSDTYNIFNAVRMWTTGELKEMIKSSGGTLVIRPDSGEPTEVLNQIFDILSETLAEEIAVNSKGFKVLPSWIRVIQGDGIDLKSMTKICQVCFFERGWSIDNIAFGSGGGLLRKYDRDTQKWAFKCSAAKVNGVWRDIRKDPITDPGKSSKAGRLDLIRHEDGRYETVVLPEGMDQHPNSVLITVFHNGDICVHHTLDECRLRMQEGL